MILIKLWNRLTHLWGSLSGKYYFEDFVRVYPGGIRLSYLGLSKPSSANDIKNFLNHQKFYSFAAQFAHGAVVADIGCGSGYGGALLRKAGGASRVCGTDISKHAVRFAKEHYGELAEFSVQGITGLALYPDGLFDLVVCSEVLEHIKEYNKEDKAVEEVKRITRLGGVVVFGTPNKELLGNHGFFFNEIDGLIQRHFRHYSVFENALVPFGSSRQLWEDRLAEGRTGTIVTQALKLNETVLPEGVTPEVKVGIPAGIYRVGKLAVDTTLLHNTHSWVVVAIRDAP